MAGDGIEFDFSDLMKLAADLGDAPGKASQNVVKALHVTSRHIKDDWRKDANRTGLRKYAVDMSYDIETRDGAITSEIGPTPGDAGSLGLVEDANGGVRSAPQHAGRDAARKHEGDFISGVLKAVTDPLES